MTLPTKNFSFIDKFLAVQKETIAASNDHALRMGAPTIPLAFIQRRLLAVQKETIAAPNDHALRMSFPIISTQALIQHHLSAQAGFKHSFIERSIT
jgi:hypothetical protein